MQSPTIHALSADELDRFARAGFVIVPAWFDAGEVDVLQRALRRELEAGATLLERRDASGRATRLALRNELGDDVFSAVARCRRLVRAMEALLGDEVYHYHHKLMVKDPGGGAWEWHQDYGYWYANGCLSPDMASALVAIGPSTVENGCLEVVPGSHRLGRIEHGQVGDQTGAEPERVAAILRRDGSLTVELEPGDVLLFHANLLHRSGPNRSAAPRESLIACYNTRSNDPVKEHHHPRYTPLEVWEDARVLEAGRRQLAP